jgi:hypothetical protein
MTIKSATLWLFGLTATLLASPAFAADDLQQQTEALKLIRETAADICNTIPLEGGNRTVELTGDAKAKLSGTLSKIADLGIEGAAKYKNEQFKGVLQTELATAIKSNADCKIQVLKMLSDKLLGGKVSDVPTLGPAGCDKFSSRARIQSEWHSSPTFTVEVMFLDAWPGCQITTVDHRLLNYSQFSDLKINVEPDRKRARVEFKLFDRPQLGFAELEFTVYQKKI